MTPLSPQKFWAVIPAAGAGKRMQSAIPKQYLPLKQQPVLQHTIERLAQNQYISGIIVAVSDNDEYWSGLNLALTKPLHRVNGGKERCHSVLNALNYLASITDATDWVLVHDAARPCLRDSDINLLINSLSDDKVGGLLAVPVRDTMKRGMQQDSHTVVQETVDRQQLWHALTPQMFHLGELRDALHSALAQQHWVTDDASAMELAGKQPVLVEGHADNIKITRPEDLALAEFFLTQQEANN